MNDLAQPRCSNLELTAFDQQRAAEDTWEALLSAGVFVEGNFTFASGLKATLKADAERLYGHPRQLGIVMGYFATFPCVEDADVLLYVPDGMREFISLLGKHVGKPVANTIRRPGTKSKYDFVFATDKDENLAWRAKRPIIGEDVVTTLGSVAALRRLLPPDQTVHSLAILLRGTVHEEYRSGLVDHYLLTKEIPTDKEEFKTVLRSCHQDRTLEH